MIPKLDLKKIGIFLIFLFSINLTFAAEDTLTINSPFYFGEEDNVYEDIHYLENEYLSFKFCTGQESENIKFQLSCSNKKTNLNVYQYFTSDKSEQSCYFTNFNLNSSPCDDFALEVDYENNNKLKQFKRTFVKQKESQLINHVLSKDFEDIEEALDLSYYLAVLNDVESSENKKSIDVYEKLKNIRNNDNKCWPTSSCDFEETTIILNNLKTAGYQLDSRLLEDGKIYLEKNTLQDEEIDYPTIQRQNDIYEIELNLESNFSTTLECELEIDGDDPRTYSFDNDDIFSGLMITKNLESSIYFSCDDTVDKIRYKFFEEKIYYKKISDNDYVDHTISQSDQDYFAGQFNYEIKFENEFDPAEEISCDLEVDGDTQTITFDEDTDIEDTILKGEILEEIIFDCDTDTDNIYLSIYGGDFEEEEFLDEDEIDKTIESTNGINSFDFLITLDYDFESNEQIECDLKLDGSTDTKTYIFDEEDSLLIENKAAEKSISLTCDKDLKNIKLEVYDKFQKKQVEENYQAKSFSYSIPTDFSKYFCIGKEGNCELVSSINTLLIYENTIEDSSNIDKFISSNIQEENNEYFIDSDNKIKDSGNYLMYKTNDDIVNYLKFKQNNDGSWGEDFDVDKIVESSYSVLGLQNVETNSEHVTDGKKWIYYNEPSSGWGDLEKNSLAYLAIKEQIKPYLKITNINTLDESKIITIENPTILNLKDVKVVFDDNSKEYLSYSENLGDIDGGDITKFNISLNNNFMGKLTGIMTITGVDGKKQEIELVEIPINLETVSNYKLAEKEKYLITQEDNLITLEMETSLENQVLTCSIKNPFTLIEENIVLTSSNKKIYLENPTSQTGSFKTSLSCSDSNGPFEMPVEINVDITPKTFDIKETEVILEKSGDYAITLNSTSVDIQNLEISVEGDFFGIITPAEKTKVIAPQDTREIFFTLSDELLLQSLSNSSKGNLLIKSDSGYYMRIPLNTIQVEQDTSSFSLMYISIGIIAFLGIIIVVARYIMQKRNQAAQSAQQGEDHDDIFMDDDMEFN